MKGSQQNKKKSRAGGFLPFLLFATLMAVICLGGCAAADVKEIIGVEKAKEAKRESESETEKETETKETDQGNERQTEGSVSVESEGMPETERILAEIPGDPESEPTEAAFVNGYAVCIDPGHQGSWVDMSDLEPNAPESSVMKAKATTGTQGKYSGVPEYQLNLDISLKLREELEKRGYRVVMTREDNDTAISNAERALKASDWGCDAAVRIHANGSEDSSVHGALAMTGSRENPYIGFLFEDSYRLASCILDAYCEATGFENLGVQFYDDMTGLNWSQIPTMILEMGFMSNEGDDLAMQEEVMQDRMVKGIADGMDAYFGVDARTNQGNAQNVGETEQPGSTSKTVQEELISELLLRYLGAREALGERWAVSVEDLASGEIGEYCAHEVFQSASVLKVFIMGAVYDRICYPADENHMVYYVESYDGELRYLLEQMIRISDNEAANTLISALGNGNFQAGAAIVNDFCQEHGYLQTSVGRRFLESNPAGDNYTSAGDCRKILSEIYHGTLVCEEASAKMLDILKGQTVKYKIPAGLPEGYSSANKTGEMPEGYGLGCIENDIAIVFAPSGDYVLAILSNELGGRNTEAQTLMVQLSSYVATWMAQK